MKKTTLGLFVIVAVLVMVGIATAKSKPLPKKPTEPVEKITFIHYKDGTIKEKGGRARLSNCYQLLGVKWKNLPVSYVINPNGYDENFVKEAISNALKEWDLHTSALLFDDYLIDNSATWDDTPEEVDYQNEYVFGEYPDPSVIAVTNIWYTKYSRQIVDYDVLFNTYYNWFDCSQTTCTSENKGMDLQNIATHETGHGIGLADVYKENCSAVTMFGYSYYGEIQKRTIEKPDITGLQILYGK